MLTRPCPWTGCNAVNEFDAEKCRSCARPLGLGVIDDRYQVEQRTGSTGWGTWYLARDLDTGRQVSVKILDSRFDLDHRVRQSVIDEAFALVHIRHNNVLGVERVIARDEYVGVVLEPFVGDTLEAIINKRLSGIPLDEVLDLYSMVLEGVKAAHDAHLFHRDLKPSNVLVDSKGIAKIVDFGLGCKDSSGARWREPGKGFYGTPAYLAPELFSGGDWSTPQGDIYALGVMLFRLVSGTLPFNLPTGTASEAPLEEYQRLHATEVIPSLRTLRAGVPWSFDRLVATACAKDPKSRYRDCRAMLDAATVARTALRAVDLLRKVTQGEPSASGPSPQERELFASPERFEEAAEALATLYDSCEDHPSWVSLQMKRIGIATRPEHKAALYRSLAAVLEDKLHLTGRAQRMLEESIALDLANAEGLQALERVAGRNRAWAEAAKALSRSLDTARDLPVSVLADAHKRLARWLAEFVADRAGAEAALNRALQLLPDDDEALRALESLLRAAGRDQDLVGIIHRRARIAKEPSWKSELYKEATAIATRTGDLVRAELLLREVLVADPSEAWALEEVTNLRRPAPATASADLETQITVARQHLRTRVSQAIAELESLVPDPIARRRALEEFWPEIRTATSWVPARVPRPNEPSPSPSSVVPPPVNHNVAPVDDKPFEDEVTSQLVVPSLTTGQPQVLPAAGAPPPRPVPPPPVQLLAEDPSQELVRTHTSTNTCRAMIRDCVFWMQSQAAQIPDPQHQSSILRESAVVALAVGDRALAEPLLRELLRLDDTCLWAINELIAQRLAQGDRLEAQVLVKRRNDLARARGFSLATEQHNPVRVVVDEENVYWIKTTEQSESDAISQFCLMQVRKDGYGVSCLAADLIGSPHTSLCVAEDSLYLNPGFGSLLRVSKVTGRTRELGSAAKAQEDAEAVLSWDDLSTVVDGDLVYWTDHEGNLRMAPKTAEGAPVVLPGKRRRYHGVVVDEQNVYWVESGRREALALKSLRKDLLLPRSNSAVKRPPVVATDVVRFGPGLNVRLIGQQKDCILCALDTSILAIDKAKGTQREAVRLTSKTLCAAVWEGQVFSGNEAGAIAAHDLRTGETSVLCAGQKEPCTVAVDEHQVYWANRREGTLRHTPR